MKRRYIHLTLWGIFTMLVLLMAGCGTNVLKGLASEPEVTNAANILKFAETKEDFEKAEDAAETAFAMFCQALFASNQFIYVD